MKDRLGQSISKIIAGRQKTLGVGEGSKDDTGSTYKGKPGIFSGNEISKKRGEVRRHSYAAGVISDECENSLREYGL
jgi:hypothetical protein